MRNIKITVEYDGTGFSGWQRQKNAPSIQQCIEEAAERIVQHTVSIAGSGRTDAGVHACGQTANFTTASTIPAERIPYALNTHLPPEIRILHAEDVAADFHACRSATGKHYRYTIWNHRIHPAVMRNFAAVYGEELAYEAMENAAVFMLGKHDFRAFRTNAKGQENQNTIKEIYHARLTRFGRYLFFDVIGNGFLYNQVRSMAGTLIEAGRGKLPASSVQKILDSGDRRRAGPTAQARGLCLVQVFYGAIPSEASPPLLPFGNPDLP